MSFNSLTLPRITPSSDLEAIQKILNEYEAVLSKERHRRDQLSPTQRLAERMFYSFSRDSGEAWSYENDDWYAPEHRYWYEKATKLMERFDDPDEAFEFLKAVR